MFRVYQVPQNGTQLRLRVMIDEQQKGESQLWFNGTKHQGNSGDGHFDGSFTLDLSGVKPGDQLRLYTKVYDVNPNTDMTRVEYFLSGGGQQLETSSSEEADTGGHVDHLLTIRFVDESGAE